MVFMAGAKLRLEGAGFRIDLLLLEKIRAHATRGAIDVKLARSRPLTCVAFFFAFFFKDFREK